MAPYLKFLQSDNARGIAFILCASFCAVGSSAFTKQLSADFSAFQIGFVRVLVTLTCIAPFILKSQFRGLWPARLKLMVFRSFNAGLIILLNIYAVSHMPLVDFTAITFTTPLFVIVLSFLVFRQVPDLARTIATLIGFFGVLLMVRPTGEISGAFGAAIAGAFCLGLGVILIRILSGQESQVRLLLWSNGMLGLILIVPTLQNWTAPSPEQWTLLMAAGLMGTLTQTFILLAYTRGEPVVIAPFDYSRILIAVAAGMLFFNEVPDVFTFLGATLVIATGVYMAREKRPAAY